MKTHRSTARRQRHISSIEPLEARIAPATFIVNTQANAGAGSLRQAILNANSTTGADAINFVGSGLLHIMLVTPLPDITEAVTIDGYTEIGASANNAVLGTNATLMVEIDGTLLSSGNGLVLGGSGGSVVKGLAIYGFGVGVNGANDNGNAILIQSNNNVVAGNFLGMGVDGIVLPARKNANSGVSIGNLIATDTYVNNLIGGTTPVDKNLIAGNGVGISLDTDAAGTTIQGNLIGTNKAATVAQPNDIAGIKVRQATATLIGGVAALAGNVISGNTGPGIELSAGSGTTIQKNFIGTNAQGSSALPNSGGVNAHNGVTGGAILGNTIAGNSLFGIALGGVGGSASGMNIKGNFIGTNSGGAQLANTGDAITIGFSSAGNTIGGTAGGDGNTIAFNEGAGVEISDGQGNSILGNNIHDNKGLGIHLQGSGGVFGVLDNDGGDSDVGPNGRQNHPQLQTFNNTGSAITLDGLLASTPNTTYRIEFFGMAPTQIDDSGYGEGAVFLGSLSVTTDNTGFTLLNFNTNISLPADTAFSATATNMTTGDTSEFGPTVGTSTSYTWTGSLSGDWNNPGNWAPNGIPGPLDSVTYNGGTSEVNFSNSHSVKSFTQNGGSLTGGQSLVILQMMDWNGGTHNGPNLLLETNAIATFSGTSALVWNGGNLVNYSLLTVSGAGLDFKNGLISNPGTIFLEAGITDSDGATTPTALNNFGTVIKNGTGSFGISGVPITGSGNLASQQGVFTLESVTVSGVLATVAMNGGDFSFTGSGLLLQGNSLLFGAGTITGDVTNDGGSVSPGAGSTGTINIVGDYTQTANGTLSIEIGGASAGQFDKLAVSGFTTLGGTLNATTINSFTPASGATFTFLTSTPLAGTFATVNGGGFTAQYTGVTASLIAATLTDMDVSFTAGSLFLTDTPGSTSAADLTVSLNGVNLRINDPGHTLSAKAGVTQIDANTVEVLFSNITGLISIDGVGGDDTLTVDYGFGSPVPAQGITFNGGAGSNTLGVAGASATTVEHRLTGAGAGAIKVDADTISYSSTASIVDSVTATDRIFTGSAAAENISIVDGPIGSMTFGSSAGATIFFPNQSASLSIFGGAGDDTITINSLSIAYNGTLLLDGGANTDTIGILPSLFATVSLTTISENLSALGRIEVGALGADLTATGVSFQNTGGLVFSLASSGGGPPIFGALSVHGALDLTGASLTINNAFTGLITAPLLLLSNDGSDAITGTFDTFTEGSTLTLGGKVFTLSYVGGDGNDLTLTPLIVIPPGSFKLGDLNGTNGFKIPGKISGDHAGGSVRSAGDVNGDGFADFILGAERALIGSSSDAGASYVVFGKSAAFPKNFDLDTLDGTTGFKIEGAAAGDRSSTSVSGGGDINGDGFADLIVGASYADTNGNANSGATYVIFGKGTAFTPTLSLAALNGTNGFRINGESSLEYAGSRVSTAGDVNGDSFADILIGQPYSEGGTAGNAYVVFGKDTAFTATLDLSALNGTNGFRIQGANNNDYFGHSISAAGDVNGDGFGDILISAPGADEGGSNKGAAYIVFGKSAAFAATLSITTLDGKIGFKIPGTTTGDQLGYSVSSAGDINGDGLDDILLATNSDGGASAGYVIFGKRKGHTASFSLSALDGTNGFQISSNLGGAKVVSSAGDFNGDSLSDFLISSPNTNTGGDSYLVFGRAGGFAPTLNLATINGTTGYHLLAEASGDHAGASLSSAGDINKDGFDDFLIGAPDALSNTGTTYLILGNGTQMHALPTSKSGGTAVTFTDTDGDIINVTTSKGKLTADMFTFGPGGGLFMVDLNANGPFKDGANLTFAVKKAGVGDGSINVGAIMGTGIQLGSVKVTGDLGQIDVGTGALTKSGAMKPALKSLTVGTLGKMGAAMQTPGTVDPLTSDINGSLPKFTVKGSIQNATIKVAGALGKTTINGDFTGLGALSLTQLQGLAALGHGIVAPLSGGITLANSGISAGSIGTLAVKGSIHNAAVNSNGGIASVNVAGNVNGGAIVAAGALKVVKVFGNITSDDPNAPSVIAALASVPNSKPKSAIAINTLTVKGNVQNAEILLGYNKSFAATNSDASAGSITVKGTWTAASLAVGIADIDHDGFGQNDLPIFAGIDGTGTDATPKIISRIASITIGSITKLADGTAAAGDYYGITAQSIGKAKINGIKLALDKNAKDNIALGTHGDFRLVEV